ncbi:uncharacterized protein LOC129773752 [Toxorhynchites rutilus septentrionalis]|uniref:uncharacterized protein LOC129773752 n=1 Tax=Toxorhynchites rutilus septentrionalis TaxID=329112 RepID=UPI00247868CD|nr:uncharacterized protein LOC129773752 [Toxorhynchites rutilus septentrionalis]
MWEVDDFDVGKALKEKEVKHHFTRNVARSGDGRYTVRLPLEYIKFMDEYVNLGHMEVALRVAGAQFFLPHHVIHRPESSTTKARIVLDANSKATVHLNYTISLNKLLQTGPIVQPPLVSTVINFRMPIFVFTDEFQQIIWRRDPLQPVQTYQLKTVTYGLTSSSYQAVAVLNIE